MTVERPQESPFDVAPVPSRDDFDHDPEVWDMIIVGAGVAGSALAYRQGTQGRRVLVIDRDLAQPDRFVGELLQPGGYKKLESLGMASCVEGIDAVKVYGYAMFKKGKVAKIAYPNDAADGEVAGRSFHHGRFVQKLRHKAASVPSVTVRRAVGKALLDARGGEWEGPSQGEVAGLRYKCGDRVVDAKAHLTVVCDGRYSQFRCLMMKPEVEEPSFFVALMLTGVQVPFPNHGHVLLQDPSPVLFYPISSTEVRCLVDIPGDALPSVASGEMGDYLMGTVYPQVPDSLKDAFERAVKTGRIRSMPNHQMSAQPLSVKGALLLGDSYNMRHPLTGGGMTVALSDTQLLSDMLEPLESLQDAALTQRSTRAFYQCRKPLASTINTLANALYKVFIFTGHEPHEEMRSACFDYLQLGGVYAQGPVSLLSGLNPRPSVLVAHFFMVALFGVGRLMVPRPSLKGLFLGIMVLVGACEIILPIIRAEGVLACFLPWLVRTPTAAAARAAAASAAIKKAA